MPVWRLYLECTAVWLEKELKELEKKAYSSYQLGGLHNLISTNRTPLTQKEMVVGENDLVHKLYTPESQTSKLKTRS